MKSQRAAVRLALPSTWPLANAWPLRCPGPRQLREGNRWLVGWLTYPAAVCGKLHRIVHGSSGVQATPRDDNLPALIVFSGRSEISPLHLPIWEVLPWSHVDMEQRSGGQALGKDGRFPNLSGRQMRKILTRICGDPLKKPGGKQRGRGSHTHFKSPINGKQFMFSYHDGASVNGGIVRQILVTQVGLSLDEARRALK